MTEPEDICELEWAEWYRLTPQERWAESQKLWSTYFALGGSLTPSPILRVLSSMRTNGVRHLLMRAQACVLYGAAEFSRDTDLAILADDAASLETALPERNLLTQARTGEPCWARRSAPRGGGPRESSRSRLLGSSAN